MSDDERPELAEYMRGWIAGVTADAQVITGSPFARGYNAGLIAYQQAQEKEAIMIAVRAAGLDDITLTEDAGDLRDADGKIVGDWQGAKVTELLPDALTDSLGYQIGAVLGDDARSLRLPVGRLIILSVALSCAALTVVKMCALLGRYDHSAAERREVAAIITQAIYAASAGRPRVAS